MHMAFDKLKIYLINLPSVPTILAFVNLSVRAYDLLWQIDVKLF